jgi:hypothetical protein
MHGIYLECSVEFLLSGGNLIQESLAPKTRAFLFICAFFFFGFYEKEASNVSWQPAHEKS